MYHPPNPKLVAEKVVSGLTPVAPDPAIMALRERVNSAFLDAGICEQKEHGGFNYIRLSHEFSGSTDGKTDIEMAIRVHHGDKAGLDILVHNILPSNEALLDRVRDSVKDIPDVHVWNGGPYLPG